MRDYTMWSNQVRPYDLKAPIIDYTLCHILYTIYSRVYTILLIIYYRLYSVYMAYLYTIARPLKGAKNIAPGHVGARL